MGEAVPAAGLQFGPRGARAYGGLRGQVHEVGVDGVLGDAGGPRVAVAVGVDHRGLGVLGAQPGVVREHHPGVHLEPGTGQRLGRLGVRVLAGHPGLPEGPQAAPLPAGRLRRVEDRGVLGGDDPVARVTRGQGPGGVVGGGQGDLLDTEPGEAPGGVRVADDVPGVDERGRPHFPSPARCFSSRARPAAMIAASCSTCSAGGSVSGVRTSPTARPPSRTPAFTSDTA